MCILSNILFSLFFPIYYLHVSPSYYPNEPMPYLKIEFYPTCVLKSVYFTCFALKLFNPTLTRFTSLAPPKSKIISDLIEPMKSVRRCAPNYQLLINKQSRKKTRWNYLISNKMKLVMISKYKHILSR